MKNQGFKIGAKVRYIGAADDIKDEKGIIVDGKGNTGLILVFFENNECRWCQRHNLEISKRRRADIVLAAQEKKWMEN